MKTSTTRIIAANTIYQILGKIFSMSITMVATVVIARAYGLGGYGAFSLMQTWPALFFVLVDFGFNAIASRDLSKNWEKVSSYVNTIFVLRIGMSLVFTLLLSIALFFFPYALWLKVGILLNLLLILTQSLYTTTNIVFQVRLRYDLSTLGYGLGYILILVMVLGLSFLHASVTWVSFSYVLGGLLTFYINCLFLKSLGVPITLKYDSKIARYLFLESLPLGLMFIFSQMNFKSDSILLSVLSLPTKYGLTNTQSVAVYSLPYKVFEVALVVPTFLMNAVYPVMVRHLEESPKRLQRTFLRTLLFLFVAGILGGAIGILFAPLIISLLGGSDFIQSVVVLQILISGVVLYFMTQPLSWLLVTLGNQRYLPWIYLISAFVNVSLNLAFIPHYSFFSSAIITHLSESLVLVLLVIVAVLSWKRKYAK